MATPAPICTDLRPSTLAGTCGLSEADWSAIQELVSGTPAVRRRAFFIAKRAGPTDGVWLEFLEARVGSAMAVDLPVAGAFNWSEESLEMSGLLHRYVVSLAADESGTRRASLHCGDASEQGQRQRASMKNADGLYSANYEPLGSTAGEAAPATRAVFPVSCSQMTVAAGPSAGSSRSKPRTLAGTLALALDDSSVSSVAPTLTFSVTVLDPTAAASSTRGLYTFVYTDSPPSLRVFLDRIRAAHAVAPGRRVRTLDVGVGTKCVGIQVNERAGSWEWSDAVGDMENGGGKADVACVFCGE